MTPEQRYLFDINGYLVIPDAVEPDALAAAVSHPQHPTPAPLADRLWGALQRAVAHEATAAGAETLSGPAWAWDVYCHPAISALAFTPKAWPVVLELTGGQPMMRLGIGLHDAPHSGGGGMLHCNREFQRSSAVGSPSMASYSVRDGKILCADFGMFVCAATPPPPPGLARNLLNC